MSNGHVWVVRSGTPEIRLSFYPTQWVVGVLYDDSNIMRVRWFVLVLGPFALNISMGRRP